MEAGPIRSCADQGGDRASNLLCRMLQAVCLVSCLMGATGCTKNDSGVEPASAGNVSSPASTLSSGDGVACGLTNSPTPFDARLIHIAAPWCPVCRKQTQLFSELDLGGVTLERADYDDPSVRRTYAARYPSTLVLLERGEEVWRHVGDIDQAALSRTLLRLACAQVKRLPAAAASPQASTSRQS